jgi:hypothetical protein
VFLQQEKMDLPDFIHLLEESKEDMRYNVFIQMYQCLDTKNYTRLKEYVDHYGLELFSHFLRHTVPLHGTCPLEFLQWDTSGTLLAETGFSSISQCPKMNEPIPISTEDSELKIGVIVTNSIRSFWKITTTHPDIVSIVDKAFTYALLAKQRNAQSGRLFSNMIAKLTTESLDFILDTTKFTSKQIAHDQSLRFRFHSWPIIEFEYLTNVFNEFETNGLANCHELALVVFHALRQANLNPVLRTIRNGDHKFVVYGTKKTKRILCDVWSGTIQYYDEKAIKTLIDLEIETRGVKRDWHALCELDPTKNAVETCLLLDDLTITSCNPIYEKCLQLHQRNKNAL